MAAENTWAGADVSASQEKSWILAAQKGDAIAFNRLVLRWERSIYNLGLRMLQDPQEAEEITQEVFWAAFRNMRRFRLDARFSTWIYRIAVNHCFTRLRKRPPGVHISLDDPDRAASARTPVVESHESEIIERQERQRVRKALDTLPPDQRAVVELKFYQDLKFDEIAAILETPASTIKTRFYSALDLLKAKLSAVQPSG